MCGIHGFLGRDPSRLFRMISAAANRGPDGIGTFTDEKVSLGQNLLAIMDVPDNSRQPWRLDGDRGVLCFNGQIYNWVDLIADVGDQPRTRCDTEVLALGLAKEGEKFLERLIGMYAIAFYQPERQEILLARDPGGMKPLYYKATAGRLAFSSELRSLLTAEAERSLDQLGLTLYFELGYVPGPRTILSGVSKLTPGEWRRHSAVDGRLLARGYIGREAVASQMFKPSTFRSAVKRSVAECVVGLRPIGLYLSGGLDSAMILDAAVELEAPVTTYSTRFKGDELEAFNEDAVLARQLAAHYGVEHREVEIGPDDFVGALEQAIDVIEEPRYNRSTPAYFLTAKALANDGCVVTLAGDGGDEVMAGYPKYLSVLDLEEAGLFEPLSSDQREAAFAKLRERGLWRWGCEPEYDLSKPADRWYYIAKFKLEERGLTRGPLAPAPTEEVLAYLREWLGEVGDGPDRLNGQLAIEQQTWLPEDALIRNDKLGMAFGMEGRFPLASRTFRNYAMGIASRQKVVDRKLKRCVRWAYEGVLPDFIIDRKLKTGWAAPVLRWGTNVVGFRDYLDDAIDGRGSNSLAAGIDVAGIQASGEPKLQYAAVFLLVWSSRWGVTC